MPSFESCTKKSLQHLHCLICQNVEEVRTTFGYSGAYLQGKKRDINFGGKLEKSKLDNALCCSFWSPALKINAALALPIYRNEEEVSNTFWYGCSSQGRV